MLSANTAQMMKHHQQRSDAAQPLDANNLQQSLSMQLEIKK